MKIAIMGAGLAGLACAITLEKHGIKPVIYEQRGEVGDRFVNAEILLSILHRPITDCIAYLSEQHGIYLHPTGHITKMTIHSKHQKAVIQGHLGFNNLRGRENEAFEKQLGRQVQSEIRFHSKASYEELLEEYTHVVVAAGDGDFARRLGNFREDLSVSIKGSTVEGAFDRFEVMTWLNYDYGPKGYGYLIPISDREANVVLAYPDDENNRKLDIGKQYDLYFAEVCRTLNQDLRTTDQFEITRYPIGVCGSPRLGNTFFVGNCFGSMMPFLGFGQLASMLTGVYAAHDLCGLGSYEQLVAPLLESYRNSLVLRRAMEQLDNGKLDTIVKSLNGFWGTKMFNTQAVDVLKLAAILLRPWVKTKPEPEYRR